MSNIKALLDQMPLFTDLHINIEGNVFTEVSDIDLLKTLITQANRFGDQYPTCHITETRNYIEIQLFDYKDWSLMPVENKTSNPNISIESAVYVPSETNKFYREILIKIKRIDSLEWNLMEEGDQK